PHNITGTGVGFNPNILDMDILDRVLEVSSDHAIKMAQELAVKEGLMHIGSGQQVGISLGSNTVATMQLARRSENRDKLIVRDSTWCNDFCWYVSKMYTQALEN
ncbi:hypothetical protein KI387_033658, partial [Taxus chinensis]